MMPNSHTTKPRLIIHGGAGNISRSNLPPEAYARYAAKLLSVNRETSHMLETGATALDAATHAVKLLENCPLFNCGKGAVFTRDGTIELEASVREIPKRLCLQTQCPLLLFFLILLRSEPSPLDSQVYGVTLYCLTNFFNFACNPNMAYYLAWFSYFGSS